MGKTRCKGGRQVKKSTLLHSEISYVISKMGHTDTLTIGDAGLPVPKGVQRIDLAVSKGIPSFMEVFEAILSEQQIEMVIMAKEIKEKSIDLHHKILEKICSLKQQDNRDIQIFYVSHEEFKEKTLESKAIIRTGEFTPYANIILVSGVVF